jgi:hypothetical protein
MLSKVVTMRRVAGASGPDTDELKLDDLELGLDADDLELSSDELELSSTDNLCDTNQGR